MQSRDHHAWLSLCTVQCATKKLTYAFVDVSFTCACPVDEVKITAFPGGSFGARSCVEIGETSPSVIFHVLPRYIQCVSGADRLNRRIELVAARRSRATISRDRIRFVVTEHEGLNGNTNQCPPQ